MYRNSEHSNSSQSWNVSSLGNHFMAIGDSLGNTLTYTQVDGILHENNRIAKFHCTRLAFFCLFAAFCNQLKHGGKQDASINKFELKRFLPDALICFIGKFLLEKQAYKDVVEAAAAVVVVCIRRC